MVEAKAVFEPFQARVGLIFDCLPEIDPKRRDYEFVNALMPYCPDPPSRETATGRIIDDALRGRLRGPYLQRGDRSWGEIFRSRIVVKFTRGSLCLGGIRRAYAIPVIHVYRDPRAVIASIKRRPWGEGAFENFTLRGHLLEISDGRAEYFRRWSSDIDRIERTNDYGRLAGYWCMTERFLLDGPGESGAEVGIYSYETIALGTVDFVSEMLDHVGCTVRHPLSQEEFRRPSSTTYSRARRLDYPLERRLFGWKEVLSADNRNLIESIVKDFGLEERLFEG